MGWEMVVQRAYTRMAIFVMALLAAFALVACGSGGSGPLAEGAGGTTADGGTTDGVGPFDAVLCVVLDVTALNAEAIHTDGVVATAVLQGSNGDYFIEYRREVEPVFDQENNELRFTMSELPGGNYRLDVLISWIEVGATEPEGQVFSWYLTAVVVSGQNAVNQVVQL